MKVSRSKAQQKQENKIQLHYYTEVSTMRTFKMAAIAAIASLSIGATVNAQTGTSTGKKGQTETTTQTQTRTQTQTEVKGQSQNSQGMASVRTEVQVIRDNYEAGRITKDQAKEQLNALRDRLKTERKARVAEIKAAVEAGRMTKDQAKAELKAEREQMKALKKSLRVKSDTRLELRSEKKNK